MHIYGSHKEVTFMLANDRIGIMYVGYQQINS